MGSANYEDAPAASDCDLVVQSWDTAAKINPNNDYSACSTWGYHQGAWKLLDVVRGRWEYPDLYDLAHAHRKRCIVRATQPRTDPPWRVVTYTPQVSEEVRLTTQTVRLEQGESLFPAEAAFLDELKREMVTFGHAKHDDQVDCVTQFVALRRKPNGPETAGPTTTWTAPPPSFIHSHVD